MGYFKGKQFRKDIILVAVGYYCRFSLSYRDVSEILIERGVSVHPTTIMRWVHEYGNLIYQIWKKKNKSAQLSWHLDETYIKVKGEWRYLYRAIDKEGYTLDIQLRKKRDHQAAYAFMKRLVKTFGEPMVLTTDKAPALLCAFKKLRGIYGYRRIQVWLKATYNLHLNHKRIQRLMSELGIKAVIRKKRPYYGKKEAYVISENHLNREFQASKPNEKWVTDITYLIFNGQRLYLSAIKDLYNNEIVAYETSRRNDLKLVLDILKKAKKRRNVKGILLHSDQGSQYTSRQYNQLLEKYQMKASMSRRGNCWDNACMENFFSHFKAECFHLHSFRKANEVKLAVRKYMHFYNHQRFQKKLNNLSPYKYRTQVA